MHLCSGHKLTFYEISGTLGRGGMGEVYRARDTRLDREVAIKVLSPAFVADEERLRRFEREARLLAALNHPNVATIYGMDQVDDTCFLALELVPGESLAQRLRRGPLALDEALELAQQVARGLAAAHDKGIVHRDLKPANVMLTPEGVVKLLDFGLAKVAEPASPGAPAPESVELTEAGRIFGTPNYMSPEQVDGEPADVRSDVWAFGCLVFECLSGERAFDGRSLTAVLAKVTTGSPDWTRLPSDTPGWVVEALESMLERDRERRPASILAASQRIRARQDSGPPERRRRSLLVPAALLLAALLALFWWIDRRPDADLETQAGRSAARLSERIFHPPGLRLEPGRWPALAPLGGGNETRSIVFAAQDGLHLFDPQSQSVLPLPDTEDAHHPFWSPDGASLGFVRGTSLVVLDLASAAQRPLARLPAPWADHGGAAWLSDGTIVFHAGHDGSQLTRLVGEAPRGDVLLALAELTGVRHLHDPAPCADRPGVLVAVHREAQGVDVLDTLAVADADGLRPFLQLAGDELSRPVWSDEGLVLFERTSGEPDRAPGLWAVAFDPLTETTRGEPFLVEVGASPGGGASHGLRLCARPGRQPTELVRVGAGGQITPVGSTLFVDQRDPRADREGGRIAVERKGLDERELWLVDARDGRGLRLGPAPSGGFGWSAAGSQLVLATTDSLVMQAAERNGEHQPLLRVRAREPELSREGQHLVYVSAGADSDLWWMQLGAARAPEPLRETPHRERMPAIAPDGSRYAFVSDESGRDEVWIADLPPGQGRWQVTRHGGAMPRWSSNGTWLYFLEGKRLMRARLVVRGVGVEEPEEVNAGAGLALHRGYDLATDGGFWTVRELPVMDQRPSMRLVGGELPR